MTDFLLELRSEEIPARMQDRAREDLAKLFAAEIAKAGLVASAIETYATPRRLALIARDLPTETEAVRHETKGPKVGAPDQAIEGFLRRYELTREQLVERGGVYFAERLAPGRPTARVLGDAIEDLVRAFPWPKSMRWGDASASTESLRWVRPLHGIVALLGEEIVACEVAGIVSGATTYGHRFHHPGPITIGSAADYADKLRFCHVIVDQAERRDLIRARATALAAEAGLQLVEDEGLVTENAGLTEWPVPLIGRFDEAFLQVPPEVIQLTARVNQKYFVCRTPEGALANAFVCTANIDATDGGTRIVEGNRKVLAARLSDARFFYEQDLKVPLEEQARKLEKIVFHEKLGTVADKVDRVAKLARWLVEEGIVGGSSRPSATTPLPGEGRGPVTPPRSQTLAPEHASDLDPGLRRGGAEGAREHLAALAERAARLCKADLVTGMVGEFPELQGLMGGYYAAAQGEDPQVAAAIRDHYKPVGQGDDVPTDPVTVAVSLADKLDTLVGFFGVGLPPTGSKDPFALRRAALGCIDLIAKSGVRMSLRAFYAKALQDYVSRYVGSEMARSANTDVAALMRSGTSAQLVTAPEYQNKFFQRADIKAFVEGFADADRAFLDFFADRLKVQQREAGVRHDLIDAVFALGGEDDLVRLLARVRALQAFVGTEDGANLLAGYKRAANILKKENYTASESTRHPGLDPGSRSLEDGPAGPRLGGRGDEGGAKPLSYTPEIAEAALHQALDIAEPAAAAAVQAEDFERAMAALASLRAPIDAFFETVTVNDPDADKRAARLALLARVRDAVHQVADFSRIEG